MLLSEWLDIKHPIIMAPMFLVTNTKMVIAAYNAGIIGCIPALNFRTLPEFEKALKEMHEATSGKFGINLIVSQSNIYFKGQLELVLKYPPSFIITSLGSPKEVIDKCKPLGIKVFCDVINTEHAQKVEKLGGDALIAVNSAAGGHLGHLSPSVLIPMLRESTNLPVISAGGVGNFAGYESMMKLGAIGVSVGSPFIATVESDVNEAYKNACVDHGAEDIIVTKKISGTPCTVIKTPYMEKLGTDETIIEKILNKNKTIKKYLKMLIYKRGMSWLDKAAFGASYKSIWCAGPSIEFVKKISTVAEVVKQITEVKK
jgi:nitronate monooxygenase